MEIEMNEEDEAFNEIERQAKQRKESVKAAFVGYEHAVLRLYSYQNELRNDTLEEVAQHIEKLKGFGADTVSGLAIYIREMKK
jgi:hypothetical protein